MTTSSWEDRNSLIYAAVWWVFKYLQQQPAFSRLGSPETVTRDRHQRQAPETSEAQAGANGVVAAEAALVTEAP